MAPTNEDYELVARFLDGEPVELTPAQREIADAMATSEALVGAALDAAPPAGALHRVHSRIRAELAPRRSPRRWARWVPAAAAAAAAVFALALLTTTPPQANALGEAEYVEAFLQGPAGELDEEVRGLIEEVATYQVELSLGDPVPLEIAFDGLEHELGETAEEVDPAAWELWEESL